MMYERTVEISIEVVRDLMERMLRAVSVPAEAAKTMAGVHLEADLRGVGVQGLNHLVSSHLDEYRSGHSDPEARPAVVEEGAAYALIDGKRGSGQLAALLAVEVATRKARESGCAMVGVADSHDLFMAGYYAELLAREGLVGLVFSDDVVPVVRPLGGVEPIIGSNPMAIAVPRAGDPFVTDFAPCATLPTYVRYAKRYGRSLPEGVAGDAAGRPTTDPDAVCDGAGFQTATGGIDPLGNKGYGLLLAIDFLSGALLGCDMGTDHQTKPDARKGHLFVALDPAVFGSAELFERAVEHRIERIKGSKPADPSRPIRVPGERSFAQRRRSLEAGKVTLDEMCWRDALARASSLGIELAAEG